MDQWSPRGIGARRLALGGTAVLLGAALTLAASATLPRSAAVDAAPTVLAAQADWQGVTLTDVRGGREFTLRDYQGQVVLLQPMAVW